MLEPRLTNKLPCGVKFSWDLISRIFLRSAKIKSCENKLVPKKFSEKSLPFIYIIFVFSTKPYQNERNSVKDTGEMCFSAKSPGTNGLTGLF